MAFTYIIGGKIVLPEAVLEGKALAFSEETHFASPKSSQIFPSNDIAIFTVTYGRPVVTCLANGAIRRAA